MAQRSLITDWQPMHSEDPDFAEPGSERQLAGTTMVAWGSYDLGKPRVRILLRGLRENGIDVHECHAEVWRGIDDKSQMRGVLPKLRALARWTIACPRLIYQYLKAPAHDVVLVPYMGNLDVLVLWPFARLRGATIVLDAFISIFNTVVEDRALISKRNPVAWLLYVWEWMSYRVSGRVIVDTWMQAAYIGKTFKVENKKLGRVFVGVEPEVFPPSTAKPEPCAGEEFNILFYGQYIPLHGIDIIVRAAKLCDDDPIDWILIGTGQEDERISKLIDELAPKRLRRIRWVPYSELKKNVAEADLCLGIFGTTDKAARVIPNKVFQILAAGKPLVTRDSPAIRELISPSTTGVTLIDPGDPEALARAAREHSKRKSEAYTGKAFDSFDQIEPAAIGRQFFEQIGPLVNSP